MGESEPSTGELAPPLLLDYRTREVVDGICGIAFWVGGLTDVVEAC